MKIITINRATLDGLRLCTGELFECNGFQFCLTKVGNVFYAIEVLSGFSAYSIYQFELTDLGCRRKIKTWIRENAHRFNPELVEKIKKQSRIHRVQYPLNERIV